MEREKHKKEKLEAEAKESYLNVEQFQYLQKNIGLANKRLKDQQGLIDTMEKKMMG